MWSPGGRDPLAEEAHLLLRHRRQDVGGEVGHLAPLPHAVDRHAERRQLLAAADPLQEPPPQPVEPRDDDGHWAPARPHPAHLRQQRLVGRSVVETPRQDVLVLGAEDPPLVGGVAAARGQLGVEADAVAGLLVGRHPGVDDGGGDPRGLGGHACSSGG
jgi:hypothetical protein